MMLPMSNQYWITFIVVIYRNACLVLAALLSNSSSFNSKGEAHASLPPSPLDPPLEVSLAAVLTVSRRPLIL